MADKQQAAIDAAVVVVERETSTALAIPGPVFAGAQMAEALKAYKQLQRALDEAMPDQVMEMPGGRDEEKRHFRKKGYWRAVAVAFGLTVEPTDERREVNDTFEDGRPNFGYIVTYRATAPNGRTAFGDGSAFAIEKAPKFRCPHPEDPTKPKGRRVHFPAEACPDFDALFSWRSLPAQATEHNVRSHAHTRAFNRAVSNLVGFGEVSAEELTDEDRRESSTSKDDTREATKTESRKATTTTTAKGESGKGKARADVAAEWPGAVAASKQFPDRRYVRAVTIAKTGKTEKGPWTLHKVATVQNGTPAYATTFSGTHAEVAMRAAREQLPIEWSVKQKGEYRGEPQYEIEKIEPVFYANEDAGSDDDGDDVLDVEIVDDDNRDGQ